MQASFLARMSKEDESQVADSKSSSVNTEAYVYVSFAEVWNILTSSTAVATSLDELPQTELSNVRLLVNLGENLTEKREDDRRSGNERARGVKLFHNSGPWKTISGNTKLLVRFGKVIRVNQRKENNGDVVLLHHKNSVHCVDPNYKRRITWLWNHPILPVKGIALVEYSGKEPASVDVNRTIFRNKDFPFRWHHVSFDGAATPDANAAPTPSDTDEQLNQNQSSVKSESIDTPRSAPQIADARNPMRMAVPITVAPPRINVADQYSAVYAMMGATEIIHKFIHVRGGEPQIVLMLPDQLKLIRSLCGDVTPLGLDRTFNLGPCYVTATVFKLSCVYRRDTGEVPIMLGPVLLHRQSDCRPYSELLRALKDQMENSRLHVAATHNITVGSDTEKALRSALQQEFPSAPILICARHLRENFDRYMADKVVVTEAARRFVLRLIFDDAGRNERNVEEAIQNLALPDYAVRQAKIYYETHLRRVLTQPSPGKRLLRLVPEIWTESDCENIDNVLEKNANWESCRSVYDVVRVIQDGVEYQLSELRQALFGEGEFMLADAWQSYALPSETWDSMTLQEQDARFDAFIQRGKVAESGDLPADEWTSTPDVAIASVSRQPEQRKRSSPQSTTPKHKQNKRRKRVASSISSDSLSSLSS